MATGASQLTGERMEILSRLFVPASTGLFEGCVMVHASATDDLIVDLPNAAAALDSGRSFAGINASANAPALTDQIKGYRYGVAKCALKANSSCVAGKRAGYVPSDAGYIVQIDATNAAIARPIGRFTQSKSSSSGAQMVGVLLFDGSGGGEQLAGFLATTSGALSANAEAAYNQKVTLPANSLSIGSVVRIKAGVHVTAGATADTLLSRLRFGGLAGVVLLATPAYDPATDDVVIMEAEMVIDSATTFRVFGSYGQGAGGTGTVRVTGTTFVGAGAISLAVANDIVATADWSADTADTAVLEYLTVTVINP